jgi:hypothetical protein
MWDILAAATVPLVGRRVFDIGTRGGAWMEGRESIPARGFIPGFLKRNEPPRHQDTKEEKKGRRG